MDIKNNIKEGIRRIWVLFSISLTLGLFVWLSIIAAISSNPRINESGLIIFGILLGAPLTCLVIYRIGWCIGWRIFEWIYDGFAGEH